MVLLLLDTQNGVPWHHHPHGPGHSEGPSPAPHPLDGNSYTNHNMINKKSNKWSLDLVCKLYPWHAVKLKRAIFVGSKWAVNEFMWFTLTKSNALRAGPLEEAHTRNGSSSRNSGNPKSFSESSVPFSWVKSVLYYQLETPCILLLEFFIHPKDTKPGEVSQRHCLPIPDTNFLPCSTRVALASPNNIMGEPSQGAMLPRGQFRILPWRAPPAGIRKSCLLGSKASPAAPTSKASNCIWFCRLPTWPHTWQYLTKRTLWDTPTFLTEFFFLCSRPTVAKHLRISLSVTEGPLSPQVYINRRQNSLTNVQSPPCESQHSERGDLQLQVPAALCPDTSWMLTVPVTLPSSSQLSTGPSQRDTTAPVIKTYSLATHQHCKDPLGILLLRSLNICTHLSYQMNVHFLELTIRWSKTTKKKKFQCILLATYY